MREKTKNSNKKEYFRKKPVNDNRNFGTKLDRDLGLYLERKGLPALAQILKIDK